MTPPQGSASRSPSPLFWTLALLVLVVAGLLATSYAAAYTFLGGIGLGAAALVAGVHLARWVRGRWRSTLWILARTLVAVLAVALASLMTMRSAHDPRDYPGNASPRAVDRAPALKYTIAIAPVAGSAGSFRVDETLLIDRAPLRRDSLYRSLIQLGVRGVYDTTLRNSLLEQMSGLPADTVAITFPPREVKSRSRGFLLREVRVIPLGHGAGNFGTFIVPPADTLYTVLCSWDCPPTVVRVRDLRRGSFYAAKDVDALTMRTYVDTESATWSLDDVRDGVVFAYTPPPFHHLRPLLAPFAGVSDLSDWLLAAFGVVGSLFLGPVVKPRIAEMLRGRGRRDREADVAAKPKVRLVVASDGTEVEIEPRTRPPSWRERLFGRRR
jgi:hypothetical protein